MTFKESAIIYYVITWLVWLGFSYGMIIDYMPGYQRPIFHEGVLVIWGCIPLVAGIVSIITSH